MNVRVNHTTTYSYSESVSICHTEVRLVPRGGANQTLIEHELAISPEPGLAIARKDYFGNAVTYFSLQEPHQTLTIRARSLVEVIGREAIRPVETLRWEEVSAEVRRHHGKEAFEAFEFTFESPRVRIGREFAEYAAPSFPAGRPLLAGVIDLCERIHRDFKYDPDATVVTTPVEEVLRIRHGVCQDFAHMMIACVRSMGLAARYVSGYIRSGAGSIGAEASHAWAAVFCGGLGWIDIDPTNNVMPSDRHVTTAWGRDYSDVPPVKGVALGGGEQTISVAVEAVPVTLHS